MRNGRPRKGRLRPGASELIGDVREEHPAYAAVILAYVRLCVLQLVGGDRGNVVEGIVHAHADREAVRPAAKVQRREVIGRREVPLRKGRHRQRRGAVNGYEG